MATSQSWQEIRKKERKNVLGFCSWW
jgi:hypothetical protein